MLGGNYGTLVASLPPPPPPTKTKNTKGLNTFACEICMPAKILNSRC